ncbi:uncharacterized protein LOC111642658 [Centruroides sculpturatus]|uniref:uncharacterized protein LOC111642658 n=1 Tax=Centruroides sculpturatus TaxID=218467 RepID=UPI000C6DAA03|nr:uncharacterized protein LOC111642658 [Centruroides sculpturatus]
MDTGMHDFESCGLWPRNRFKIGDEEYVVLDEDANLSETAEVSQNLATERQQEQTEEVEYPQLPEVPTTHPSEKQQDQCLEEKAKECSLGMKVNISNTETVRATFEIISPLRGILGIARRKTYERILVRRKAKLLKYHKKRIKKNRKMKITVGTVNYAKKT